MAVEDVVNDSVVDSIVLLVSSVVFIGINVLVVFVCCIVDEAVELLDCVVTDDWSVREVAADDVIVFTGLKNRKITQQHSHTKLLTTLML